MPSANITKKVIADGIKHLMQTIPFDRITTADIIAESGISRKTFYYHFRDKYDVVNSIFTSEILDSILESTSFENWLEGSYKFCHYIKENQVFYTNAVNASGQNCFIKFLRKLTEKQVYKLCNDAIDRQVLSKDDYDFLVEFYYHAFIGVFTLWVRQDMKETPERIVDRWAGVTNKSLENYILSRRKRPETG